MKTDNDKDVNKIFGIFGTLFVVICCSVLYKTSIIDIIYLLIVLIYFGRYLYLKKFKIGA